MNQRHIAVTSPSFSSSKLLMTELASLGISITPNAAGIRFGEEELIKFLAESEATAAVVGLEAITRNVLNKCPRLKLICKYGVGTDNLDIDAMKQLNVKLGWSGGVNRRSVSELAMAFALGHSRNVIPSIHGMRSGRWEKIGGREVSNLTVGIIGFGFVGQDLAQLLSGFRSKVIYCDILDKSREAQPLGATRVTYEEIITRADIVSFHVPSTADTRHMYGRAEINKSKSDVLVINTARGDIVDFHAVASALRSGSIGGYASDVFPEEPFDGSQYSDLPNFYFTPHIGGNSREAVLAMGRSAIDHLRANLTDMNQR